MITKAQKLYYYRAIRRSHPDMQDPEFLFKAKMLAKALFSATMPEIEKAIAEKTFTFQRLVAILQRQMYTWMARSKKVWFELKEPENVGMIKSFVYNKVLESMGENRELDMNDEQFDKEVISEISFRIAPSIAVTALRANMPVQDAIIEYFKNFEIESSRIRLDEDQGEARFKGRDINKTDLN